MSPDKLKKLEELLKLANDGLTKEEFVQSFETVIKIVKDIKDTNTKEWNLIHDTITKLSDKVQNDSQSDLTEIKKEVELVVNKKTKEIDAKIASVKDGRTPTNAELEKLIEPLIPAAMVVDEVSIANIAEKKLEENLPALGKAVRDGLELLSGSDRLNISAIEGIEEFDKSLKEAVAKGGGKIGWGAHPLVIQQSGTVKAKVARVLNFTGATVSVSPSGVITVAVSGGSGLTYETPSGTVDGVNKTFVATSPPSQVIIDGIVYFLNNGFTLSGNTITTTVPPTGYIRDAY